MIKSPKERFQQSQIAVGQWMQLVSNPIFEDACDVALLQLLQVLPSDGLDELQKPYSSHMQMVGAQNLVRILKTLHEKPEPPKEHKSQSLQYDKGI